MDIPQEYHNEPNLLARWAAADSCCIHRVPRSIVDDNLSAFRPQIVSIGPFYHGEDEFQMIEEHKRRYLIELINRTGIMYRDLLNEIRWLENQARESYSQVIEHPEIFLEMLVLDGCFIIELFYKYHNFHQNLDDPLLSIPWIYSFLVRDLIKIENQIPFFIIQALFHLQNLGSANNPPLSLLALNFFSKSQIYHRHDIDPRLNFDHLLDLVRKTHVTETLNEPQRDIPTTPNMIQCISNLRKSGISTRKKKVGEESFLGVEFKHGTIEMPIVTMDEVMSCFIVNCIMFEQSRRVVQKQFTTYAVLLYSLVKTDNDVDYLLEKGILQNYSGTKSDVVKLFNDFGKGPTINFRRCYLTKLFVDVDNYYNKKWHVWWETLFSKYFRTSPWALISFISGVVLFLISGLQTFYTVYPYYRPPPPHSSSSSSSHG